MKLCTLRVIADGEHYRILDHGHLEVVVALLGHTSTFASSLRPMSRKVKMARTWNKVRAELSLDIKRYHYRYYKKERFDIEDGLVGRLHEKRF